MPAHRTYLDYNATAPLRPEARSAMLAALDLVGNASSVHAEGRRARAIVETAREQVAALVGAKPSEVIFTSGATEANATVIAGRRWGSVLLSAIEHPSVLQAAAPLHSLSIASERDGLATVDDELAELLGDAECLPAPMLVSLQLANGETGVVQNVGLLAEICRRVRPGTVVHSDAAQAAGRITIDFASLGVDAMTISSHKLGGPQGAGALIIRDGIELSSLVRGGGQERGRRAGTENIAAIAGFGAAAQIVQQTMTQEMIRAGGLRAALEQSIADTTPDAEIIGCRAPRIANTTCVALPGARAETLVIQFDLAGIAVSAGAACSSGKVGANQTLLAMGLPENVAQAAIRVSLGWQSTQADVAAFSAAWRSIAASRRRAA